MLSKVKTQEALQVIAEMYPEAKCELTHRNSFELLIAVLLSAQTTDVAVNKITPALFARFPTVDALAEADQLELESYLRTIGLYRNKAKNMRACAQKLRSDFNGQVPATMEELISLPGVGRKTANVVLGDAFGVPSIAVDTHVERVSKRLAICKANATVLEVEETLQKKVAKQDWTVTHHRLIFFGRYHCTARAPKCAGCPLLYLCRDGQSRMGKASQSSQLKS